MVNGRFNVIRRALTGIGVCIAALWLLNTNLFTAVPVDQAPRLLSHRGVHQTNGGSPRGNDSCTANPLAPITHGFIENTIPSMQAAERAGAEVIELDVHLTPDNVFAVFHDWTVDCRTDGTGQTNQIAFADLQKLDLGYGYSDDGVTFPLRGQGIGMMPSLADVFAADIGAAYLVNFKSKNAAEGTQFAKMLDDPANAAQVFGVYGGAIPTQMALDKVMGLRGFDRGSLKACLLRYFALGWSGYVPDTCRDTLVAVPMDYAPYFWGWPHRFTARMQNAGSDVILWGPYDGTGFSSGVDDANTWVRVPRGFDGYVWTNKIEVIGPLAAR